VINPKGETIRSKKIEGKTGFNQVRWDLVTRTVDSPEPYFIRYREFAPAGEHTVRITGKGIDLRGRLVIRERETPPAPVIVE
jgi:hypothetical protein